MASCSVGPGVFDPQRLAMDFIKSVGIDPLMSGYKLFKLRDKATSKEVNLVFRQFAVRLGASSRQAQAWCLAGKGGHH